MIKNNGENIEKPSFANAHLHVYVNKAKHGAWAGRVEGPRLANPLFFDDFSAMLLLVDEVLDEQNFPRAYERKRTFAPITPGHAAATQQPETEKGGDYDRAFVLQIISRQNTSWQGMIDWLDNRDKQPFASELELLRLLENEL